MMETKIIFHHILTKINERRKNDVKIFGLQF